MKNIFFVFALMTSTTLTFAQSLELGRSVEEFRSGVNHKLEEIKEDMNLQISSRGLNFSDYKKASEELVHQIDVANKEFSGDLHKIESFISWYESVRNSSVADRDNRALERLMAKKEEELKVLRKDYQKFAQKYVMLGSHLSFPVTRSVGGDEPISMLIIPTVASQVIYFSSSSAQDMYKNTLFSGGRIFVDESYGEALEKDLIFKSRSIFQHCRTQGCVYYLAEDIALWIKKSHEVVASLTIPVEGIRDFKAQKQVKFRKIQKALDKMADLAATERPVSL